MDEQTKTYPAAANDAIAQSPTANWWDSGWQHWAFAGLICAAYVWLDVGTRWDLAGTYELDKDTNLFARIATGYRAPSMQGRLIFLSSVPSFADAERALSYEAGIKQDLFDKRARMSASVFQYRVKDKQLTATSGTINMNQLINADKVTGQGVELDFQANLSESLRATIGGSYNDTEIDDADLSVRT